MVDFSYTVRRCVVVAQSQVAHSNTIEIGWGRVIFHAGFIGVLAIVLGQIVPVPDGEKVAWANRIGWSITGFDILFRLPLYYLFVNEQKRTGQPIIRVRAVKQIFEFLEKWLLIKPGILRTEERGLPTTVVHATLGIILSLELGLPLWAVVPAVVIFGFGDPAARVFGKSIGGAVMWEGGTKRWAGIWGYFSVGSLAGLLTIFFNSEHVLYPSTLPASRLILAVLVTAAISAYFESLCEKDGTMFSRIVDDNLVLPFVGSVTFYAIATAGTM